MAFARAVRFFRSKKPRFKKRYTGAYSRRTYSARKSYRKRWGVSRKYTPTKTYRKRSRSFASRGKKFAGKFTLKGTFVGIAQAYLLYAFISIVKITKDTGVGFIEAIQDFLDDWLDLDGDGQKSWYEFTMAQWLFIIIVGIVLTKVARK